METTGIATADAAPNASSPGRPASAPEGSGRAIALIGGAQGLFGGKHFAEEEPRRHVGPRRPASRPTGIHARVARAAHSASEGTTAVRAVRRELTGELRDVVEFFALVADFEPLIQHPRLATGASAVCLPYIPRREQVSLRGVPGLRERCHVPVALGLRPFGVALLTLCPPVRI